MAPTIVPHSTDGSPVTLCVLGDLGVRCGDQWIPLRGERTWTLLAAIIIAGDRGVHTDELVEKVWPGRNRPPSARQSLANMVLRVRRSIGKSVVETTSTGYRIGEGIRTDRAAFVTGVRSAAEHVDREPGRSLELLETCFTSWRGEPWHGLEHPVEIESDRAMLLRTHACAVRTRAKSLVALGRGEAAIPDLSDVLRADPFDEACRHDLVRVLAERGDRAAALRTISDGRRALADRGLEPGSALIAEEQRLLGISTDAAAGPGPLPQVRSELVGRDRELAEIESLLNAHRLVTMHGAGGGGKTRLAIHLAHASDALRARFVDLTSTRTQRQVDAAFAHGLGLPVTDLDGLDRSQRIHALARSLTGRPDDPTLIVVDNCEHVLTDVRDVLECLLDRPGRLRVLATSRVPLGIDGEYRYAMPRFDRGAELFAQRSSDEGSPADPDRHAATVARICDLVDHLPLGIELAAAQTPYRTIEEIAHELEAGAVHRDRAKPSRHETLFATIKWTLDLIDDDAGEALVRLGVFDGPFECADAAAVIALQDARPVLDTLVRHCLVHRGDRSDRSTYRLPVPVRQYAVAELVRRGDTLDIETTLADWLLEFTDRPVGDVWWRRSTIDEIRCRLQHAFVAVGALRASGRMSDATVLASRLGGAARASGHADELIGLLTEPWPDCADPGVTADALVTIAGCADTTRQRTLVTQAIRRLDALGEAAEPHHRVVVHCEHALWSMWGALLGHGDLDRARIELQHARHSLEVGESPIALGLVDAWQSGLHLLAGEWAEAEEVALRSLDEMTDTEFAAVLSTCFEFAQLHLGRPREALAHVATATRRRVHEPHGNLPGIVESVALVQAGDVDDGLASIEAVLRRSQQASHAIHQDDAAIAIAYIAHLRGHDDLALPVLESGVLGYGPWVGHLVPRMCRELGLPLMGHDNRSLAERKARSSFYGRLAADVLAQLRERNRQRST